MFASSVHAACFLLSAVIAALLLRSWSSSRIPLVGWAAAGFCWLAASNGVRWIEELDVFDGGADWSLLRVTAAALGAGTLLVGLVRKRP